MRRNLPRTLGGNERMKKAEREAVTTIVREAICAWKPFPWAPESPSDPEFRGEVNAIAKQRERMRSQRDTAEVVSRVFQSSFGRDDERLSVDKCLKVGAAIFEAMQKQGLVKT